MILTNYSQLQQYFRGQEVTFDILLQYRGKSCVNGKVFGIYIPVTDNQILCMVFADTDETKPMLDKPYEIEQLNSYKKGLYANVREKETSYIVDNPNPKSQCIFCETQTKHLFPTYASESHLTTAVRTEDTQSPVETTDVKSNGKKGVCSFCISDLYSTLQSVLSDNSELYIGKELS